MEEKYGEKTIDSLWYMNWQTFFSVTSFLTNFKKMSFKVYFSCPIKYNLFSKLEIVIIQGFPYFIGRLNCAKY